MPWCTTAVCSVFAGNGSESGDEEEEEEEDNTDDSDAVKGRAGEEDEGTEEEEGSGEMRDHVRVGKWKAWQSFLTSRI